MKIKTLFAIFMAFSCASYGQHVGIGTSSPAALLDVSATDDGILIPRVALTGSNTASPLTSPAVSTLVYNTATAGSGATAVIPGFYYWNGSAWILFVDNSALTENTTVSNTSSANTLSTTVNGTTGSTVPMVNTNVLSQNGTGQLISTINGIGSTPYTVTLTGDVTGSLGATTVTSIQGSPITVSSLADGNMLQYSATGTDWVNVSPAALLGAATTNTLSLSTNTLTSTVNGIVATSPAVSGVSNTSTDNTLSTTVNGMTGSTVPIINTNALGLSGTSITSTINGVASSPLDISSLDNNIYNADGTLTGTRTVTMAGNTLNFTGGNVGIGVAGPSVALQVAGTEYVSNLYTTGNNLIDPTNPSAGDIVIGSVAGTRHDASIMWWSSASASRISNTSDVFYMSVWNTTNANVALAAAVGGPSYFQGNVGIGTTSPQAAMDVTGTAFIRDNATLGSVASGLKLIATGGSNYIESAGAGMASGTAADLNFTSMNAGANWMTIKSTGNVGIGTNNPGYTLDLNSGTFGYGVSDVRTEYRTDAGLQGNAGAQSGFFQNDGSTVTDYPAGSSGWMHLIDCRHSNGANNYAMQFTGSFFDQNLYFRKTNNNPAQPWARVMTSTDVSGTTNYISKFTSANTIGNSVITDDGNVVVVSPPTYTYFNSGSVYAQNLFIARGGITNDGGNLELNGAGGAVSVNNVNFDLNSRSAIQDLSDGWERLNQNGSFTNGTYTPGFFRADGGMTSGGAGGLGGGTIYATNYIYAASYLRGDGASFLFSDGSSDGTSNAALRKDAANAYLWPWGTGTSNNEVIVGGGASTNFAVSGSKSALVPTSKGHQLLYSQESPEVWFEDFGAARIDSGRAHVALAADFSETVVITAQNPIKVFVAPTSEIGDWWIEKTGSSFTLHAPHAADGATFDYRVMAKRKGYENERMKVIDLSDVIKSTKKTDTTY